MVKVRKTEWLVDPYEVQPTGEQTQATHCWIDQHARLKPIFPSETSKVSVRFVQTMQEKLVILR